MDHRRPSGNHRPLLRLERTQAAPLKVNEFRVFGSIQVNLIPMTLSKTLWLISCLIAGMVPVEDAAADHTIYQDGFSRTGLLNGSSPEAGAASWVASGNWSADGSRAAVSAPSSAAFLPFKPRAGNRYTLSVRMHCTAANPVYEWMALGFADGFNVNSAWHIAEQPTGAGC